MRCVILLLSLGDARAVVNQAPRASGLGPSGFHPCRTLVNRRRVDRESSEATGQPCSGAVVPLGSDCSTDKTATQPPTVSEVMMVAVVVLRW